MLTWILHQFSIYYGNQVAWITDDLVRIEHSAIGLITILHRQGSTWRLVISNSHSKEIFDGMLDESDLPKTECIDITKSQAKDVIAGMPATEFIETTEWNTKLRYWMADEIRYPHECASQFVCYHFFHLPVSEILLRHSSEGRLEFDTTSCVRETLSAERLLERPLDFKMVATASELIAKVAPEVIASGPHAGPIIYN